MRVASALGLMMERWKKEDEDEDIREFGKAVASENRGQVRAYDTSVYMREAWETIVLESAVARS